jgi:hypothetical protein
MHHHIAGKLLSSGIVYERIAKDKIGGCLYVSVSGCSRSQSTMGLCLRAAADKEGREAPDGLLQFEALPEAPRVGDQLVGTGIPSPFSKNMVA